MKIFIFMFLISFSTSFATDVSPGDEITAASVNSKQDKFTPVHVFRYHAGDTFDIGSYGLVRFTGAEFQDTDGAYNGTEFIVPQDKGGLYLVNVVITANSNNVPFSGYFEIRFVVNGTTGINHPGGHGSWAANTPYPGINISMPLRLSSGDSLRIYGLQSTGSALPIFTDRRSHISIVQLSQD